MRPDLADRTSNDPNTTRPDFLTLGGNSETPFVLDENNLKEHHSLEDFETLDDVGRALGERYHGGVHINLGGTMASFDSPMDPAFYSWHGEVDGVVQEWLQTDNGQAWAAANPEAAAPWGGSPTTAEPPIAGSIEPIEIPDETRDMFSNLAVGFDIDVDSDGVLETSEISDFLQSEYGMDAEEATRVAGFIVRASEDGSVDSGQELAQLMGVETLEHSDLERLVDFLESAEGGDPFNSGSVDSQAVENLKLQAALSAETNGTNDTEVSIPAPNGTGRGVLV